MLTCVPNLQEDDPLTVTQRWWGWRGGDKPPTRQHLTSAATDNLPSTPLNADCVLPPSLMTLPLKNMLPTADIPMGHFHSAPPMGNVHSAPPMSNVHSAPPLGNVHSAPQMGNVHTAPPMGNSHSAPPMSNVHSAPPLGNVHSAPQMGNVHTAPPMGNVHSVPPMSNVHSAPPLGNVHSAPQMGNVHTAPPMGNAHSAPPLGNAHSAPPLGNAHSAPPMGNAHSAPPMGNVHSVPPMSSVHSAPPMGNVQSAPPMGNVHSAPPMPAKLGKKSKSQRCTFCDVVSEPVLRHQVVCHLPWFFDPTTTCWVCEKPFGYHIGWSQHMSEHTAEDRRKGQFAPHFTRWSHMMIGLLNWATTLLQTETYAGLIALFTQRGWCSPQMGQYMLPLTVLAEVATMMDMPIAAKDIHFDPPNHPVSLLVCKSFISMSAYIRPEQRDSYKRYIDPSALPSGEHTVHAVGMDTHCRRLLLKAREDKGKDPVPTWDALFSQWRETVQEDSITVDLAAVVDNRVDPSEWQRPIIGHITVNNKTVIVKTTYGAPPRLVTAVDRKAWELLETKIRSVDCCAIGQCGLDYNAPASSLPYQRLVFQQQIALAKELNKPLILCLQGSDNSESTSAAMEEALLMLEANTVKDQKIHIHGFIGSFKHYRAWLRAFPNTIFGISHESLETKGFSDVCCCMSLHHLALETNTPQLSPQGVDCGHPYDVVRLAQRVAECHNVPSWVVLRATADSSQQFYQV